MSAYVVLQIEVTDAEKLAQYREIATPIVQKYGGRYLARGGRMDVVEGDSLPRIAIVIGADLADRRGDLLRVRIPVRPAGVAAVRRLPRLSDLCARDRDAATIEARLLREMDRRRAGPGRDQAGCAVRPADLAGYVALLFHARDHDRHL